MFSSSTLGVLLGTVLLISSIPDAVSYSKYGRTCKDIGCRSDEVCIMAEDPCSIYQRDNCGRYPTCSKSRPGGASCASTVCGDNEYCKTENGVPKCVKISNAIGYETAGVSYVNGQRIDDKSSEKTGNTASNSNPYANANAPPYPADPPVGYHQTNAGNNLGYPPYPSNAGSNVYPSNQGNRQSDLGYPPYPTSNKMPVPGQTNHAYPGQSAGYPAPPGYPQQYPGYQYYPYANYPNQNRMHPNVYAGRRNAAITLTPSSMVVVSLAILTVLANKL